ncbi:hypothetical protein [Actinomadura kijaniata]|uniref:hypothetical protein n=1 Tax=Actinomadura kijaniata TaxID=46161 RepID=UPI00083364FC|nr:hypothetical protein [Actinomadura kijaniata]
MTTPEFRARLEQHITDLGDALGAALNDAAEATDFALTAHAALDSCLDHDDDAACQALDGLSAEQLRAVEDAAVALSLHASRLRHTATRHDAEDPDPP